MIRIGKIVATHGLQGAVILTHIIGNTKWLKKDEAILLELHRESYIPFFVTHLKATNNEEFIVQLEDVATVEAAKKLIGKQVYVKEQLIAAYATDTPLAWMGFKVIDDINGEIGTIEDVMQTAEQWLAKLTYKDTEVLIPLIKQMIKKIDLDKKTVFVSLPEGLLEVYL